MAGSEHSDGEPGRVVNVAPSIDYGTRLRAGIIVPSGNPVAEPEISAMLPDGVSALFTRLELRGSSEQELLAMLDGLEGASRLLSHAEVGTIVFHCTAVSTFAPELAPQIVQRIARATGIPGLVTADAILHAITALGGQRVALLTPYNRSVHEREIAFLESHGVNVVHDAFMGLETNSEMARLAPAALRDWVLEQIKDDVDTIFLSCTALRSAGIIQAIEQRTQRSVVTSNQAMAWQLLRANGISDVNPLFGRLFSLRGERAAEPQECVPR